MPASTYRLTSLGPVAISGEVADPKNVSGIGLVGDFMLLVCDETAHVEVLKKTGAGYTVGTPIRLGPRRAEWDLEAVATSGNTVHVVGSHSKSRGEVLEGDSYPTARKKIASVQDSHKRDVLARFTLAADGTALDLELSSLRRAIESNSVLAPFAAIPGKENGIDIEGLAVRGKTLVVGFRGPVLRGNFVPVMVTKFGKRKGELVFLNLGGRGVRDLTAAGAGYLVLAGSVGQGPGGFQLYYWNGRDCLPGAKPAGACEWLCDLPVDEGVKPEGLAVQNETAAGWEFVLVCDGVTNGNPTAYRLERKS